MTGTFLISEILNLRSCRTPRQGRPQFRLQNFLLRRPDWETSNACNLHIGEQGELGTLEKILDSRFRKAVAQAEKARKKKTEPGALIFPTARSWSQFQREIRGKIGRTVTLTIPD